METRKLIQAGEEVMGVGIDLARRGVREAKLFVGAMGGCRDIEASGDLTFAVVLGGLTGVEAVLGAAGAVVAVLDPEPTTVNAVGTVIYGLGSLTCVGLTSLMGVAAVQKFEEWKHRWGFSGEEEVNASIHMQPEVSDVLFVRRKK